MKHTIQKTARIGLMAAAVFAASALLQIPIPTAIDNTRLHMGNVLCLLSGLLLGPIEGGLAAGVGSLLFDLTNPAYIASAPFTFAFKFLMAWICGKIAHEPTYGLRLRYVVATVSGSFVYVILYLTKSFVEHRLVLGLPADVVLLTVSQKAVVSCLNAVLSIIVSVPLGLMLHTALSRRE